MSTDLWDDLGDENGIESLFEKGEVLITDLLGADELLQEISDRNEQLLDYFSNVDNCVALINVIKSPSGDEKAFYKFPYVAAESFKCFADKLIVKIAKPALFDALFDILNLPSPLENRIAAYFANVLEVLVSKAPKETYNYVSEHKTTVISGLYKHFNCLGMVDAARFLLDLPINKGKTVPWWNTPETLLEQLANCLMDTSFNKSKYTMLFITSIIQRATVSIPGEAERTSVSLLPYICSVSFIQKLFTILSSTEVPSSSKRDTLRCLSRYWWKSLSPDAKGLGGEDGVLHTLGLDDRCRLLQGVLSKNILEPLNEYVITQFDLLYSMLQEDIHMTINTPYAPNVKRFGDLRLAVCEFISTFITNPFTSKDIITAFTQKKFVTLLLSLCTEFPRLSYLHVATREILTVIVKKPAEYTTQVLIEDGQLEAISNSISTLQNAPCHTGFLGILYEYISLLNTLPLETIKTTDIYKSVEEKYLTTANNVAQKLFDVSNQSPLPDVATDTIIDDIPENKKTFPPLEDILGDDMDSPSEKVNEKKITKKTSKKSKKTQDNFDDADFGDFDEEPSEKKVKKTTKKTTKKVSKKEDNFDDADFGDFDEQPTEKKVKKSTKKAKVEDTDDFGDFDEEPTEKKVKKTVKKTTKKASKKEETFDDADFDDF
ncbi:hypothetical protein WA158_007039 [Blastocystis sp. Blastoise]